MLGGDMKPLPRRPVPHDAAQPTNGARPGIARSLCRGERKMMERTALQRPCPGQAGPSLRQNGLRPGLSVGRPCAFQSPLSEFGRSSWSPPRCGRDRGVLCAVLQRPSLEEVQEQGEDPGAHQISSHTDLCAR